MRLKSSTTSILCLSAAAAGLLLACQSDPEIGFTDRGIDADGDGVADSLGWAVDKNDDGEIDEFDFHGDGSVVGPGVDTNGDGEADAIGYDTDDDGIIDALDTDGDGVVDSKSDDPRPVKSDIDIDGIGGATPVEEKPKGNGEPEICDGKDNDGDGGIDNVDAGGDGICDCLNIGTIGRIGPWSTGGDIFKDWLDTRSPIPARALANDELTEEAMAGLDVIVVLRADTAPLSQDGSEAHHEFSTGEVDLLESWVRGGGGLMTTIGYQGDEVAEMANVNRLLAPLGLGYDPANVDLNNGFLDTWDDDHPVANGVSKINIQNGVRPLADSGTVVAYSGEKVGLVADEVDDGRILVFGDEWVTYDSEWEDTEDQQVELLWLNMIKWMSPPKKCQVEIPPRFIK